MAERMSHLVTVCQVEMQAQGSYRSGEPGRPPPPRGMQERTGISLELNVVPIGRQRRAAPQLEISW